MAIKWKSTVKKIPGFLKLHWTQVKYVLGALLLALSVSAFAGAQCVVVLRGHCIPYMAYDRRYDIFRIIGKSLRWGGADAFVPYPAGPPVRRAVDA